jgi:menaquinone-dependent protoporphyrinogen IX oxidase
VNVLVVYSTRFGNTERLARAIASALEETATVRVVEASAAEQVHGDGVDLLIVGAPTQVHGLLLGVRGFLRRLKDRGFSGRRAAAFDTRLAGELAKTGSAAAVIGRMLQRAGLTLIVAPESFLVADYKGPLADREEARAMTWARRIAAFEGSLP